MPFIVFKTLSQVNNFIKRNKEYRSDHGCGCCWTDSHYRFDPATKLVLHVFGGQSFGSRHCTAIAIGRLK